MKVRVAKSAGFCFGVKRAVQMVYDEAEKKIRFDIVAGGGGSFPKGCADDRR